MRRSSYFRTRKALSIYVKAFLFITMMLSSGSWAALFRNPIKLLTRGRIAKDRSLIFCRGGELSDEDESEAKAIELEHGGDEDIIQDLIARSSVDKNAEEDKLSEMIELEDGKNVDMDKEEKLSTDDRDAVSSPAARKAPNFLKASKDRHCSDIIQDLVTRSSVDQNTESKDLRQLITQRRIEYLHDLKVSRNDENVEHERRPPDHPKKLLKFLAPKIPAIRSSRDIALRIQSARSDMDSGVAACLIGTIAYACELYDNEVTRREEHFSNSSKENCDDKQRRRFRSSESVASDIVKNRRFEQVVECILCGVDVKKRKKEHQDHKADHSIVEDIEEILDGEEAIIDEGLKVRDACRAAWGLSILNAHLSGSIGGENVMDVLLALSLRIRELLLARLQLMRQDDLLEETSSATLEELLKEYSEEIAEDAATAMWAFACVRACTGMRSAALFEVCCSILCQDPFEMRQRAGDSPTDARLGHNDVVDRLARSEVEENADASDNDSRDVHHEGDASDPLSEGNALIDLLSPNEVTDVLWALALHDSKENAASRDEIALSDNVVAFTEIAFDRLVDSLQEELKSTQNIIDQRSEKETMTVEVVDAASLLNSEKVGSTDSPHATAENMTVKEIDREDRVQQVEVVDAATLLAKAPDDGEVIEIKNEIDREERLQETEVVDATTLLGTAPDDAVPEDGDAIKIKTDIGSEECNTEQGMEPIEDGALQASMQCFSPHDLCSIAWAVTELRDSLRCFITDLVTKIFINLGPISLRGLSGGDLSNLAWAMARHANEDPEARQSAGMVTEWIAAETLRGAQNSLEAAQPSNCGILQRFQPPELSRLVWAAASSLSSRTANGEKSASTVGCELSRLVLTTASSNQPIFEIEDLARISWAFLEMCGTKQSLSHLSESVAIGRILSTIEVALLRWETGEASLKQGAGGNGSVRESTRFAYFFGRKRFNVPFLDQRLDESIEDFDENPVSSHTEKSRLPLLRDLPVDPSTLCKAACCFSRLATKYPAIKGSETLVRVALRLLTSKGGRLLRECPLRDVVRVCEAVATTSSSVGREMVSHFTRRIVRLLNDDAQNEPAKLLSVILPHDLATLLWSLGELGVKQLPWDGENEKSAYRRLQLVVKTPLMRTDQMLLLPNPLLVKLLRGFVAMNAVSSDRQSIADLLDCLETRLSSMHDMAHVCDVVETVGALKASLEGLFDSNSPIAQETAKTKPSEGEDQQPESILDDTKTTSSISELQHKCDSLLTMVGANAFEMVQNMKMTQLRRLMSVYSLLPFQSDELVDAVEKELKSRLVQLESSHVESGGENAIDLLRKAGSYASAAKSSLLGDETENELSPFAAIKKGLNSLFRHDTSEEEKSELISTKQQLLQIEKSIDSIHQFSAHVEKLEKSCGISVDAVLQEQEKELLFELGRCRELVAVYRRVDFSSGSHESRYDKDLRRHISKQILSRLRPRK